MKLKKLTQRGVAPTMILIIVVVVLAVAGVGYYVWQNQNNDSSSSTNTTEQITLTATNGGPDFNPASTEDLAFEATISGTQEGQPYNATLKFDGDGNSEIITSSDGQEYKLITTPDAFYSCSNGTCYKMSNSAGSQTFDTSDYEYTEEDITAFRSTSTYVGERTCASGTCNVWQLSDETGNTTLLYVDTGTNRITQIDLTSNGETVTISYDYKNVTIEIPANATELQTP